MFNRQRKSNTFLNNNIKIKLKVKQYFYPVLD